MKYDLILNDIVGYYPVTGRYVRSVLSECKGKPVNVFISSLGGSLQDGLLIRQAFLDHGDVTAYIYGFTASAATIMALGAKKVVMADSAMYMVHCCSTGVWQYGSMNAEQIESAIKQMESTKEFLGKTDGVMAYLYAKKSGKKAEDCFTAMQKETWMTAQEAKDFGLIDEIANDADVPAIDLNASVKARITACGLPLPVPQSEESVELTNQDSIQQNAENAENAHKEENIFDSVMRGLKQFFSHDDVNKNSSKSKKIVMDKTTLPLLLACLTLEQVTADASGLVTLTSEQLSNIEAELKNLTDKITALEAEKKNLTDEKTKLEAQVESLGKQDGAETKPAGLEEKAPEMSVKDRFNALKGIL